MSILRGEIGGSGKHNSGLPLSDVPPMAGAKGLFCLQQRKHFVIPAWSQPMFQEDEGCPARQWLSYLHTAHINAYTYLYVHFLSSMCMHTDTQL